MPPRRRPRRREAGNAHQHVNGKPLSSQQWTELRGRWASRLPLPCARCGQDIQPWQAWELDHVGDPHVLRGDASRDDVAPSHQACNRKAGADLGSALNALGRRVAAGEHIDGTARDFLVGPESGGGLPRPGFPPKELDNGPEDPGVADDTEPDPTTPEPTSADWDACPWLAPLLDIPGEATWPRLMSPPHPDAVGSFGPEAVAWIGEHRGVDLRWWQRLAIFRLLEHDAGGTLVWLDAIVSTARQVGKSVVLRELGLWRMHAAGVFGDPQTVLHTGANVAVCREVQRPVRRWCLERRDLGYLVREANDQQEMESPDGSRYLLRAKGAVYGFTGDLALADEGWKLEPSVVEDGLEPTMAERSNAQLIVFSTAHRLATSLVPLRRAAAFVAWGRPDVRTLVLEWSAPRAAALDDRAAWRMASPHWSSARERLLEGKLARTQVGYSEDPDEDDPVESFRSQYLNIWPARRLMASARTQPLADRDTWAQATDLWAQAPDQVAISVAVEDYYGLGAAAAAVAQLEDGRLVTWGGLFATRPDAYAWAAFTVGLRPGCRLMIGASLSVAEATEACPRAEVSRAGTAQTSGALPLMRSLLKSGGLVHSGDEDLALQVRAVQLVPTATGGLGIAHRGIRSDLLRATAWAVADCHQPTTEAMEFYVY